MFPETTDTVPEPHNQKGFGCVLLLFQGHTQHFIVYTSDVQIILCEFYQAGHWYAQNHALTDRLHRTD